MRGRRVRAGFHGASHLRRHLGATPLHSAALSAAFGAAPMLRAKMWLTFAASCAGVVLAGCPPPGLPRNAFNTTVYKFYLYTSSAMMAQASRAWSLRSRFSTNNQNTQVCCPEHVPSASSPGLPTPTPPTLPTPAHNAAVSRRGQGDVAVVAVTSGFRELW